ncbi:uncharacterized protein LOC142059579 [Phalacrocorax aristotelis]|uniref:uncharacterized protein LOC142059579 n=1 Tax=Phalacrocorax aristotelis TaxID=126867 RepID=UPI003F4B6FD2
MVPRALPASLWTHPLSDRLHPLATARGAVPASPRNDRPHPLSTARGAVPALPPSNRPRPPATARACVCSARGARFGCFLSPLPPVPGTPGGSRTAPGAFTPRGARPAPFAGRCGKGGGGARGSKSPSRGSGSSCCPWAPLASVLLCSLGRSQLWGCLSSPGRRALAFREAEALPEVLHWPLNSRGTTCSDAASPGPCRPRFLVQPGGKAWLLQKQLRPATPPQVVGSAPTAYRLLRSPPPRGTQAARRALPRAISVPSGQQRIRRSRARSWDDNGPLQTLVRVRGCSLGSRRRGSGGTQGHLSVPLTSKGKVKLLECK